MSLIANLSISSICITDTETGVSCNVVFFFVEVTTISSISNEFAVCASIFCEDIKIKSIAGKINFVDSKVIFLKSIKLPPQ